MALVINYIFLGAFSALLIIAAVQDARHFIISNWIPYSISGLFLLAVLSGWAFNASIFPSSVLLNVFTMVGVLAFFIILFATGQMGGGDVKLIAATSLWAGPALVFDFVLITALAGGVIAAVQLVRNGTQAKELAEAGNHLAEHQPTTQQKAVPYGLAIAAGGVYCAQQLLNQLT